MKIVFCLCANYAYYSEFVLVLIRLLSPYGHLLLVLSIWTVDVVHNGPLFFPYGLFFIHMESITNPYGIHINFSYGHKKCGQILQLKKESRTNYLILAPPPLKIKSVGDAVMSSPPLGLLVASKIKF